MNYREFRSEKDKKASLFFFFEMSDDGVWNRVMAKMSSPFVVISPAVGNKPQKNGGEKRRYRSLRHSKERGRAGLCAPGKGRPLTVLLDAQHLQLEVKVFSEDQLQYERLIMPAITYRPSIVTPHVPSVVVEAETTEEAEKILESGFADVLPFKMEETYYVRQSAGDPHRPDFKEQEPSHIRRPFPAKEPLSPKDPRSHGRT